MGDATVRTHQEAAREFLLRLPLLVSDELDAEYHREFAEWAQAFQPTCEQAEAHRENFYKQWQGRPPPFEMRALGAVLRFEGAESEPEEHARFGWRINVLRRWYWRLSVEGVSPDLDVVSLGKGWMDLAAALRKVSGDE